MRWVLGQCHPCPVRPEQQVIVYRDRPELLAIAEAVLGIGQEGGLELLEQLLHDRSQHKRCIDNSVSSATWR
jgi:hypothetical protein